MVDNSIANCAGYRETTKIRQFGLRPVSGWCDFVEIVMP